jgi:hypothetical protein
VHKLSSLGTTIDLFHNNHNFHPYTFGYNGENLKHYDQVLTAKEDYGSFQTLDYIFQIVFKNKASSLAATHNHKIEIDYKNKEDVSLSVDELKNSSKLHMGIENVSYKNEDKNKQSVTTANPNFKLLVDYTSSEIEHFLVSGKPYQQLSDHFGLCVSINYNS